MDRYGAQHILSGDIDLEQFDRIASCSDRIASHGVTMITSHRK
jgi:hypothetical protein